APARPRRNRRGDRRLRGAGRPGLEAAAGRASGEQDRPLKRREFIIGLGLGAAACGGSRSERPRGAPGPAPVERDVSGIEESPIACQGAQSPLLFHGGTLLQATDTQIRLRDARTLADAGAVEVATANLCPLGEGVVAALLPLAPGSIEGAIARIALATRSVET